MQPLLNKYSKISQNINPNVFKIIVKQTKYQMENNEGLYYINIFLWIIFCEYISILWIEVIFKNYPSSSTM